MSALLILAFGGVMVATAFLSGIFGMAGGLILIGVLLVLLPVPEAMALHAVTQMASNGWRGLLWWRHVRWHIVTVYLVGCALALGAWSLTQYVPSKPVALLMLGVTPFLVRLLPASLKPNPDSVPQAVSYGVFCTTLMLLTGVSGPIFDTFFLGGSLDRREIVATKSVCQVFGHAHEAHLLHGTDRPGRRNRPDRRSHRGGRLDARHLAGAAGAGDDDRHAVPGLGDADHHGDRVLLCRVRKLSARAAIGLMELELGMQNIEPLIFDLVEWVAKAPRTHADVMNTWRTSCPRLTVWEDAVDRGLVERKNASVVVTAKGRKFLEGGTHSPLFPAKAGTQLFAKH